MHYFRARCRTLAFLQRDRLGRAAILAPTARAIGTRENPQTERELIYRALLELRADLAEVKNILRDRDVTSPGNAPRSSTTLALPEASTSQPIKSLDDLESEAIQHALNFYHGNRRHAASALGISERSLYRKLKEKGLEQV